jgi:hypothetical protein
VKTAAQFAAGAESAQKQSGPHKRIPPESVNEICDYAGPTLRRVIELVV